MTLPNEFTGLEHRKLMDADATRLEGVTVSVGFDDMLDATLGENHPHFDTMIIVTNHQDRATQKVAQKHGCICVQTDIFNKNGRKFNKGAAINHGFNRFQYHGWRMHLDSDIILPNNFRRIVFNHTMLDESCIYGADRIDVIGKEQYHSFKKFQDTMPHADTHLIQPWGGKIHYRYHDYLNGYVPVGYFQLWHCSCQKEYPWSLGTAAHDDVAFAIQWPRHLRRIVPGAICYHLLSKPQKVGENWDGNRKQPRFEK